MVAVGSFDRYRQICAPGLSRSGFERRILVLGALGIAEAYEVGRRLCGTPWALYLHEDTELLVPEARDALVTLLEDLDFGAVVGAAGSHNSVLPWWAGDPLLGRVAGSSVTAPVSHPENVDLLDGVVLAQATSSWPWTPLAGWHGYDAVRCLEASARGLPVVVAPELECRHESRQKGEAYHRAHMSTCRRIARWWRIPCAYA